ncbi:MAG: polysaccharide deacetylase family protein [bacterium]|nr:polysaccharide deacetylase family protein [bacterium]
MRAVLTFHGVDDSGSVLSVSSDALAGLVAGVRAANHEIVPQAELMEKPEIPDRVALTFDDGFRSVHDAAFPVLRDADAPATLFLTTGFLGSDNHWPGQPGCAPRFSMLDWEYVEALHGSGWAIEAHTGRHLDLRTLGADELDAELAVADEAIEARLGRRPEAFAYPYGYHDERVRERASRRYRWSWTTRLAALSGGEATTMLPRLDAFYLRSPHVYDRFGGSGFSLYPALRRFLREVRGS